MPRNYPRNSRPATPTKQRIPISVKEARNGDPSAIRLRSQWDRIYAITGRWDVNEELAGEQRPIKTYIRVTIAEYQQLTVFRNMVTGRWYLEEISQ